jgi:hypothetical protein
MLGSRNFKKALCSSAAIALITAAGLTAAPNDANATASAYSALEVTDMLLGFSAGQLDDLGVPDNADASPNTGGFTQFSFRLQGLNVQLGATTDSTATKNINPTTVSGLTLDQTQLCLVDCTGFTDNDYVSGSPGPGNASPIVSGASKYAVSDSHILNSIIGGGSGAVFGTQAGAQSSGGGTLASGTILTGSKLNWDFSTDSDDAGKIMSMSWLEDRLVAIETTRADETAQVSISFTIDLFNNTDGTSQNLFTLVDGDFTPEGAAPVQRDTFNDIDASLSTTGNGLDANLLANKDYSLVFAFSSFATATSNQIPEPGTLGLLGAGLIGLGALGVRRRRKAA